MAEGYVKLLSSVLDSSIWAEPDDVVKVWVTLMAMADKTGYVGASVGGIARRTVTVSVERVAECLEKFQQPDPDSRTSDHDGRRIEKVDRGFLLLNYAKIRSMHAEASQREAKRLWWQNNRSKSAAPVTTTTTEEQLDSSSASRLDTRLSSESSRSSLDDKISSHGSVVVSGSVFSENSDAREDQPEPKPEPVTPAPTEDVASSADIPCPRDLALTDDQRATLESAMVPGWAIDVLTASFVASQIAGSTPRPLVAWRKCLAKAINGDWNNPRKRPKRPQAEGEQASRSVAEYAQMGVVL